VRRAGGLKPPRRRLAAPAIAVRGSWLVGGGYRRREGSPTGAARRGLGVQTDPPCSSPLGSTAAELWNPARPRTGRVHRRYGPAGSAQGENDGQDCPTLGARGQSGRGAEGSGEGSHERHDGRSEGRADPVTDGRDLDTRARLPGLGSLTLGQSRCRRVLIVFSEYPAQSRLGRDRLLITWYDVLETEGRCASWSRSEVHGEPAG